MADDGFLWDVNYGAYQIDISAVRSPEPSSLLLLCVGFAVLALCAQRKLAKKPSLA
jgi:PEP-CTERM motif-containing protein